MRTMAIVCAQILAARPDKRCPPEPGPGGVQLVGGFTDEASHRAGAGGGRRRAGRGSAGPARAGAARIAVPPRRSIEAAPGAEPARQPIRRMISAALASSSSTYAFAVTIE